MGMVYVAGQNACMDDTRMREDRKKKQHEETFTSIQKRYLHALHTYFPQGHREMSTSTHVKIGEIDRFQAGRFLKGCICTYNMNAKKVVDNDLLRNHGRTRPNILIHRV